MGHRRPGYCPAGTGRVDEAAEYFTRADAAGDQVGAGAGSILRTYGQAIMASDRGQYAAALALFVQAHDGFQRLEVAFPTGLALAGSLPPTNISVTPEPPRTVTSGCCGTPNPPERWGSRRPLWRVWPPSPWPTANRHLLQSCWPGPPRSATPTIASSPNATSRGPADASSARSRPTRPVCPANHTCTSEKYARSTRHQSKIVGETSSDRKALSRLLPRILCSLLWMWKHE